MNNLIFDQPRTAEDYNRQWEAIRLIIRHLPYRPERPKEIFAQYVPYLTVVYYTDGEACQPIGLFALCPLDGKSMGTVEMHGVCREDLGLLFDDPAALKQEIYDWIFQQTFFQAKYKKIILKIMPEAKAARVFAVNQGFQRLPGVIDKGRTVWKMTAEGWFKLYRTRKVKENDGLIQT